MFFFSALKPHAEKTPFLINQVNIIVHCAQIAQIHIRYVARTVISYNCPFFYNSENFTANYIYNYTHVCVYKNIFSNIRIRIF